MLAEPGERFTRLRGPDDVLLGLQPELHGHKVEGSIEVSESRAALMDALGAQKMLADTTKGGISPRIAVHGQGAVAALLKHAAHPWAEIHTDPAGGDMVGRTTALTSDDGEQPQLSSKCSTAAADRYARDLQAAGYDALVTCAGWLPDSYFGALDDACHGVGLAWHHCHVEGTSLAVGPLQVPGGARYRDWRGRRLAASTTPDELEDFWAYLDSSSSIHPPVPRLSEAVVVVAVGHLLGDLQRWWVDRSHVPAVREHLVAVDDEGRLDVTHHPVLPLPVS